MVRPERGTTLLEAVIVVSVFSFMAYCVYALVASTVTLSAHSQAWGDLTESAQHGVNQVVGELPAARRIFRNDAQGNAYLAAIEPPSDYPVLGNIRLPVPKDLGTFRADEPGDEQTGNALLFCKQQPIFQTTLQSGISRRVDVYTLVFCYPSPVARAAGPYVRSLALARWESIEFGDYLAVMALSASERTEVAKSLYEDRGVRYLWDVSQNPDQAFYGIDGFGAIDAVPLAGFRPPCGTNRKVIASLGLGRASMAWNRTNPAWIPERVPYYAIADATGDGFPHGFEVQVIGPTGSRTILVRLTLARFVDLDGTMDAFSASAIANGREF